MEATLFGRYWLLELLGQGEPATASRGLSPKLYSARNSSSNQRAEYSFGENHDQECYFGEPSAGHAGGNRHRAISSGSTCA